MSLAAKLRRGEGPVFGPLKRALKAILGAHIPVNALTRPLFRCLYRLHVFVRETWIWAKKFFWTEPLFRSQCESVGPGLRMEELPYIAGVGRIVIGANVRLSGQPQISFGRGDAEIVIGDGTFIGHACGFNAGKSIRIGRHCLFATGVLVYDLDGHPLDANRRPRRRTKPAGGDQTRDHRRRCLDWHGGGDFERRDHRRPGRSRRAERRDERHTRRRGRGGEPGESDQNVDANFKRCGYGLIVMLANIIIPAASLPYLALLLPWNIAIVLTTETAVWKWFNCDRPWSSLLKGVFLSNLASTLLGCITMNFIPLPWGYMENEKGLPKIAPEYVHIVVIAMIIACFLSIAIEYLVLFAFRKNYTIRRRELCVVVANTASYAGISLGLYAYVQFGFPR